MARRLEQATEDALLTGGRAGQRAVQEAGFSEELKEKLLDRVQDAKFRNQFAGAFAQAGMPASAGEGTRGVAAGQPWTGDEPTSDAVLRMLDDARKPLKPGLRGKFEPPPVDMRIRREPAVSPTQRVANARDKAFAYSGMGAKSKGGLTDKEKDELRNEFRERFTPGARGMPNSLSGLAAMANERIEDAIARGQFKNIPRGTGVQRDTRADNPFIDTTEYIMNKMIQRQEIVPPWIEKQQDLMKQLSIFRARLRNDWKRHAARMVSARGGSLQEKMREAERYARAERVHNPRMRSVDQIPVPSSATDDPVMVKMRQQVEQPQAGKEEEPAAAVDGKEGDEDVAPQPFRDAEWERAEGAYIRVAVDNLNSMTRAYNLMAPDLAKKPYLSAQRELAACFADVAPQVAGEIQDLATRPRRTESPTTASVREKAASSLMDHFRKDNRPAIYVESRDKAYGFREWWRDVRGMWKE